MCRLPRLGPDPRVKDLRDRGKRCDGTTGVGDPIDSEGVRFTLTGTTWRIRPTRAGTKRVVSVQVFLP